MLEEFLHYFQKLEIPEPIQRRAEELCTEFGKLIPTPIRRVYVTDLYDGEGIRRYQNLILVSGSVLMECKNFIVSDNIDFIDMECGVKISEITKWELKNIYEDSSTK